jgi:hypothetical protein
MTWFKVDDRFHSHPKVLGLSLAAAGLWVRAGSWCAAHETDGHLNKALLRTFKAPPRLAQELVNAGLWRAEVDGFSFKNWIEFQPTSAQLEQKRLATSRRVSKHRNAVTNASPDPVPIPIPELKNTRVRVREEQEADQLLPGETVSAQRIGFDWMFTQTGKHWMGFERTCAFLGSRPAHERVKAAAAAEADPWIAANRGKLDPDYFMRKWPSLSSGDTKLVAVAKDDGQAFQRAAASRLAEQLLAEGKQVKAELAKLKPLVAADDPDARAQAFTLDNRLAEIRERFD